MLSGSRCRGCRQGVFLRRRAVFGPQFLDDAHLLLRPLRVFEPRVEQRQIVVRLLVVGAQLDRRLQLAPRALVILPPHVAHAEGDARVGEVGEAPRHVFQDANGSLLVLLILRDEAEVVEALGRRGVSADALFEQDTRLRAPLLFEQDVAEEELALRAAGPQLVEATEGLLRLAEVGPRRPEPCDSLQEEDARVTGPERLGPDEGRASLFAEAGAERDEREAVQEVGRVGGGRAGSREVRPGALRVAAAHEDLRQSEVRSRLAPPAAEGEAVALLGPLEVAESEVRVAEDGEHRGRSLPARALLLDEGDALGESVLRDKVVSFMAGGDYAMVRSIEQQYWALARFSRSQRNSQVRAGLTSDDHPHLR